MISRAAVRVELWTRRDADGIVLGTFRTGRRLERNSFASFDRRINSIDAMRCDILLIRVPIGKRVSYKFTGVKIMRIKLHIGAFPPEGCSAVAVGFAGKKP